MTSGRSPASLAALARGRVTAAANKAARIAARTAPRPTKRDRDLVDIFPPSFARAKEKPDVGVRPPASQRSDPPPPPETLPGACAASGSAR